MHDSFYLRADNEPEKQNWLLALNLAQREAGKNEDDYAESTGTDTKSFEDELKDDLDCLFDKLQDVKACQEKLNKSGLLLQKQLTDLDILERQDYLEELSRQDNQSQLNKPPPHQDNSLRSKLISDILKSFKEKNGSYKIALSSTINSCNQFSLLAQQYFPKWCRKLQKEHETNRNYEQVINQLANHIKNFEEQIKKENNQLSYSNEEDEKFYDAEEFSNEHFTGLSNVPGKAHRVSLTGDLNSNSAYPKRNSIKYEIKSKEPDQSTLKTNHLDNQFNNNNNNNEANDYTNYDDEYTNESSDREDELSLSSCNEEDTKLDNKLDEMIKSSVVLVDNEKLNDSFSRNSSSNNIINKYSNEQNSQSSQDSDSILNRKDRVRVRRTRIPERPNHSLNLWSILKNSIGRDLSKIPMPVNFSEPLSLLQRITGVCI